MYVIKIWRMDHLLFINTKFWNSRNIKSNLYYDFMLYTLGMIIINKLKLLTITNCFGNIIYL